MQFSHICIKIDIACINMYDQIKKKLILSVTYVKNHHFSLFLFFSVKLRKTIFNSFIFLIEKSVMSILTSTCDQRLCFLLSTFYLGTLPFSCKNQMKTAVFMITYFHELNLILFPIFFHHYVWISAFHIFFLFVCLLMLKIQNFHWISFIHKVHSLFISILFY